MSIERDLKNAIERNNRRRNKEYKGNNGGPYYLQYDVHLMSAFDEVQRSIKIARHHLAEIKKIEKKYKKQQELDVPPVDKLAGRNTLMANTL